jgi:hypothetical protein
MLPRLGSLLLAALTALSPTLAHAGCLTTSRTSDLLDELAAAETAYADLDPAAFGRALDDATLLLPCLSDVPTPEVAARVHRLTGLRLYAAGENELALASMQAARILDPTYRFPDETLPADHALRVAYEALPAEDGDAFRPPQPIDGSFMFDGIEQPRRPLDRSTLFQLVESGGTVETTRMLEPGEPLPEYRAKPRARNRLLVGSALFVGASAGLLGAAVATDNKFDDLSQEPTLEDLQSLQAQSQMYATLSAVSFGVGVTGGVLAFTVADGPGRR